MLSVVMVCLPSIANADKGNALHKLLSTILSSELSYEKKIHALQQDFNISVTQEMEGKLVNMCNLSQAIEEKNLEIGIQKGIEKGIQKGIQKGMQKGMQKGIKKGENDLIFVLKSLKEMGRNEDADAILFDENRRKEIYEEFGIS